VCVDSKQEWTAIEWSLSTLHLAFRSRPKSHRSHFVLVFGILVLIGLADTLVITGQPTRASLCEGAEVDMATLETKIVHGPSIADLLAYAYRNNPTIKASRAEWRAKVARYRVETAYDDPEIMAEGMYMTQDRGGVRPDDWKVSLTQTIPFPGKLGKAGQVATAEAQIGRLKLDATVRDLTVQLRESYQELLYIQEARRVADQNRELLDQLRKVGETAYAQNRAALVDAMKAQSQSGQLLYDALLLEELERTEKTRLNSFLSRPPEALIGPLSQEPLPLVVYKLDEIYTLAEQNLEEVRMAQAGVEKARSSLALARYEILPQFKLGASIGEEDSENQVGVLAGLSVPLWFGKNAGRLEQARAEVEVATAMKDAQVNESRAMVRDTYFRLQNSERLVRLYRDQLLPQAAKSMELAETWYRQKQGSFSDFIETEAVWYNFQLALARAKADYGKFLARLEKLAGRSLSQKQAIPNEAGSKEGSR